MSSSRPSRPSRPVPALPTHHTRAMLTPIRAHYLKKSLVQLQFRHEIADITNAPADNASTLAFLGPPFAPPPRGAHSLDLPFLRYIFKHFVLTFPFMATAPKDFYSHKLQPFVASLVDRNISNAAPLECLDDEECSDVTIFAKIERNLATFFTAAIKLVEPEQVLRLSQLDLDRLERAVRKRRTRHKSVFDVNIICVRSVTDKGRVRNTIHDEFIIRTRLSESKEVCVPRRYGDFRTLANELRKVHTDEIIPSPPSKDRTAVDISSPSSSQLSPMSYPPAHTPFHDPSQESLARSHIPGAYHSPRPPASRLFREKNRLTLRAYLHTLLATPSLASSPVLRSFLLSSPITLTQAEKEDALHREEADRGREESRKQFAHEIGARVEALRNAVRNLKGELMDGDGLTQIFGVIRDAPNLRQLPENYRAVIEWGRISFASALFQTYVAADDSSQTFAALKRIHGLMPYLVLKAALKISNPVAMLRSVLDVFLAQPFGGRSLLQRMFTSSMAEEAKSLATYIQLVSDKIADPCMCEKVRMFAYAPRETQELYRASAVSGRGHLLCAIMYGNENPVLDSSQLWRIQRAARRWDAWQQTRHRGGDDDPPDEEAWLFEDLRLLMRLYLRLRDREQLIALIFEGVTAELLKDIITIFYTPLAQVYKAASIADSFGDVQNFLSDLIRTVEQTESIAQMDPGKTVQAFIDLVIRHEQGFYTFVHNVHTKGAGLFDDLTRWVECFFSLLKDGVGADANGASVGDEFAVATGKFSLETLLPAGNDERAVIFEEVDRVARYHYTLKVAHEERVRRRFQRSQGASADDADEEARALVQGVMNEIRLGEGMDALLDDEDEDEDDEDEDEEDDEDDEDDDEDEEDEDESDESGTISEEEDESRENEAVTVPPPPTLSSPSIPCTSIDAQQSLPQPPTPLKRTQTTLPQHFTSASLPPKDPRYAHTRAQMRPAPPRSALHHASSLRPARSMMGLRDRAYGGHSTPPPPVPKIHDKPLPPTPRPQPPLRRPSSLERMEALNGRGSPSRRPVPSASPSSSMSTSTSVHKATSSSGPTMSGKGSKKKAGALEQPELVHIANLLPVFVEMMRPLLSARS